MKAAPVLDGKEILFDPHFRARGQFDVVEQPLLGKRLMPAARRARSSRGSRRRRGGRAPLLGEHNDEVLRELGYSRRRDREAARKTP